MSSSDLSLAASSEAREYRFRFTGTGGEYFAIWIVNLLLSILTIGIYSAWAKVRREQYFHRNTLLDDQPFDYTGRPLSILIGRIAALVLIGVGSSLQQFSVTLALAITALFAAAYPWIVVRSLRFRARNTRYRNLAFRFTGTTWQATRAYGWIYLALAPLVIAWLVLGPELAALEDAEPEQQAGPLAVLGGALLATVLLIALLMPVYLRHIKAFIHANLRYGNAQGEFDASVSDFYRALARTAGIGILAILLIGLVTGIAAVIHLPLLAVLAAPLLLLSPAAYAVYITNTTYAHATIGGQHLLSDMALTSYTKLTLVNLILMLVTFGLAWPWIKVRVARYRCERTALIAAPAALTAIAGEAGEDPAAFGEEAAEFLDFDISL